MTSTPRGNSEAHLRETLGENTVQISAIVPAYNAAAFLKESLTPLMAMAHRGEICEVIVADDCSTDESANAAAALGAKVISTESRSGPGAARNLAAGVSTGEILWFVDADVVVHEDAARIIASELCAPDVVGVFGSYNDKPTAPNFLSQYKNLVHCYYHQRGRREASTFWAACGAVRKKQFLSVGGFDTVRYEHPSIEDVELGARLTAGAGRIKLIPTLQGTHLKTWRLFNLLHTEIFRRAIPWSRLLVEDTGLIDDLNVGKAERFRAALAGLLFLSLVAAIANLVHWWLPGIILVIAIVANRELAFFLYARKGVLFAVGGLLFHQLYYCYSSVAFVSVWLLHRFSARS